jgi:coatomer subunit alpha
MIDQRIVLRNPIIVPFRFWILAAHSEQNLLAAGHDSGMIVFKLERERPAFDVCGGRMFYVKDKYLRMHEFGTGRDVPVVSLRRGGHTPPNGLGNGPRGLAYNNFSPPTESSVLITSVCCSFLWMPKCLSLDFSCSQEADGGSYELVSFNADAGAPAEPTGTQRGSGLAAVFIARNRFAVLDKNRQVSYYQPPVQMCGDSFHVGCSCPTDSHQKLPK